MKSVNVWFLYLFLLLMTIGLNSYSQTIKGTITDQSQFTLPGVSVYLEGTTIGTVSDFDGNYELIIKEGDIITDSITVIYSFIGFKPQKFIYKANPSATITNNIILLDDIAALEEFVVVGYGVQRKSDVTGALSTIDPKGIVDMPLWNAEMGMQGKAAGVQVNQTTGAPGESIKVRIRGIGTINDNSPLYIVDGVPTKDISGIVNPEDIESMTVLKDAASAAIYGSRAGNGVIVIKTKRGSAGKTRMNYSGYVGLQQHGHITPMTNTDEYIKIYNEAAAADDRDPIPEDIYPQLSHTDWMEETFQSAMITNHQLTISGGNENSTYLIGGGYQMQEGIIYNSEYERVNFRMIVNSSIYKWLDIGTNLTLSYSDRDIIGGSGDGYGGNGGSVVRYALFRTPAIPVYESDGSYSDLPNFEGYDRAKLNNWFGDGYNPVGLANKYDWTTKVYRTFGNVYANFKILDGLSFRSEVGINLAVTDEKRFNETWGTDNRINSPNNLSKETGTNFTYNWTNTLVYNRTFSEKHKTTFLLGTEAIKNQSHFQSGTDRDFPDQSDYLRYLGNGLTLNKGADEGRDEWSLLSVFARVNYNYDNRYLIEGVVRFDGSSRFSSENQWGGFYSGSVGWNMKNENFLQDVRWLNQLKIRASIGQTGNQEIGLYNYLSIIGTGYNYPFGGTTNNGYAVSSMGDINTAWETTTTYDLGLDLAFLNDRLFVTSDYYWRYTTDMLIPVRLPQSGGSASPPWVNAGEVLNRGFEFQVIWQQKVKEFSYTINANFSTLHNEVLSISNGRPIAAGRVDAGANATLTEEGHPIGSFYMYEMEGIFQNELDIFSHAYQGPDIEPGDVMFKDQNQDGMIDENDRVHVASAIPNFMYGLTTDFSWKGFDLSLFFQGVSGNSIYVQVNQDIEGFYRGFNVTKRYYDDHWTEEGSTNETPRASWVGAANNKKVSSRFIEPGSYFRFKNVTLGYTFSMKESSARQKLRVYVGVQNVFTVTKYPGLDPEMYNSDNLSGENVSNPDLASGIDWGTYPVPRIYTLGVNLNF
ncbi:MAG: TonB-dependent receptor [Bacteroidales bacterium]|nr:TonB-dependent receptor [Bacteroidales bacterium]